jgi:hypothetical protein
MRFSLFPHLFQCVFFIWVPNMASFLGPTFIFTIVMFRGVLEILHTHLGFLFPIFFPMFIIHY